MMDVQQAVQQTNMELRKVLARIDYYYSRMYHLRMLIFLAQAIVPYEQLKGCENVLEVYDKIVESRQSLLRGSESAVAVALLRYMLRVTGYKREDELRQLDVHCSKEFNLSSHFPALPFFERLLVLSSKLLEGGRFKHFWSSVDENKLNQSKLDVKSSPLDLFQSMLYKRTLDPDNYSTITEEVVPLLKQCKMAEEAQQVLGSTTDGEVDSAHMYFTFEGKCLHDPECMRPLLTSKVESKSRRCLSAVYVKRAVRGIKVSCSMTFLFVFVAAALLIFAMPRLPEHTQAQLFNGLGSLTYAPFPNTSIDRFYYNQIKVTAAVGSENDFKNFNLTVCNVLCPLETVSDRLPTVKEASSNNRLKHNWYVNLRGWPSPVDSSSQYNTLYMLKGSLLMFSIIRLVPLTDVQLHHKFNGHMQ